jgi:TatA/E family protein of Tat protein translocase
MDFLLPSLAFIEGLGGGEMILIFVIVLVLFGGEKLPDFARGLGKSIREFKKAASGVEEEFKRALDEDAQRKSTALPPPSTFPAYPPTSTPPALEAPPADEHHAITPTPVEPVDVPAAPPAAPVSEVAAPSETPSAPPAAAPVKPEPVSPVRTDILP